MKKINLGRGYSTKVDDQDFEKLSAIRWRAHIAGGGRVYAATRAAIPGLTGTITYLHRFLMETPDNFDTDHINGDSLDNQRHNLRIVSHSENLRNSRKITGGTWFDRRTSRWVARITIEGKRLMLGRYQSRESAHLIVSLARLATAEGVPVLKIRSYVQDNLPAGIRTVSRHSNSLVITKDSARSL